MTEQTKQKKETPTVKSIKCTDNKCYIHNKIRTHGRVFKGKIINEVFHKTATIEFPRQIYISKYERFEKRRSKIKVHIPSCFNIKKGNTVLIKETRPISKTKNFVVIEVLKK